MYKLQIFTFGEWRGFKKGELDFLQKEKTKVEKIVGKVAVRIVDQDGNIVP